ncbi:unnamed protein product, partial [Durusdinium trenchii]
DGQAQAFRYTVSAKTKVNVFTPKSVVNPGLDVRSTVIGACLKGKFKKLSGNTQCQLLWEVKLENNMPAVLSPFKPKLHLTCSFNLPANT